MPRQHTTPPNMALCIYPRYAQPKKKNKQMKKTLYLTLLICPFLLYNCGPDNPLKPNPPQADTLPPITTEGLQTFGYKVNGEVIRYGSQSGRYINLDYLNEDSTLHFQLESGDHFLGLSGLRVFQKVKFLIDSTTTSGIDQPASLWVQYFNSRSKQRYNQEISGGGEILKLESTPDHNIVSGTFWCTLINQDDPKDTVYITDGRFDLMEK
jgi:hypothetical protein